FKSNLLWAESLDSIPPTAVGGWFKSNLTHYGSVISELPTPLSPVFLSPGDRWSDLNDPQTPRLWDFG
ncbi:MAG TPA: hypothetical protein VEZ90_09175, partial [Blastocatellia bacterium]|nr:hypothetical protein [Blastocatellia bacterium]